MNRRNQSVRVGVFDRPLDPAAAMAEVGRPDSGATAVFIGTVRDHSAGREGISHLDYEAFEERVEDVIRTIVDEALDKWPVLAAVVEHRIGRVELGDPAVVVAVSTAHRGDAFEAARFLIDELKARAPLWKKENWPGGSEWIEGA